jgi:hypothetical protein
MPAPLVGLAVGAAARAVAKKAAKTAVKKTIKKTTKRTAAERGFAKDKASRAAMKKQDIFYGKVAKEDLKSGDVGISKSVLSKSRSVSKPKVPIKKRGK